ncbi:MAG: hypothetical protein IK990_06110, partial [Ruminiclostridium sp.]|nr:hypothetical protein [Ruminiclostridium sp.]
MKINKILAAGMAATLAVTSLSAVVSAETVTKSFDMGTSIATYKLNTTENWLSLDFLAELEGDRTIPSNKITPPLVDGDKLIYDFTDAFFETWGHTVKTDTLANGGLKINSVTLKVTGIMGSKNNASKEYSYSFANENNAGKRFILTVNKETGKGFIPTQFVEITKAEVVIDWQFDSISETLFQRAKNSDNANAEWGGGLQNIKVTKLQHKETKADETALKTAWDAAVKDEAAKKTAYEEAQKATKLSAAAWDALKQALENGTAYDETDAATAKAIYDKAKANYDKAVAEVGTMDDAFTEITKIGSVETSIKGGTAPTYDKNTVVTDAAQAFPVALIAKYNKYNAETLAVDDTGKTLDALMTDAQNEIFAAQADKATAEEKLPLAEAKKDNAADALRLATTKNVVFDAATGEAKIGGDAVKEDDLDASAFATGDKQKTIDNYANANAEYQELKNAINTADLRIANAQAQIKKITDLITALQKAVVKEAAIILGNYKKAMDLAEAALISKPMDVTQADVDAAKADYDAKVKAEDAAKKAYEAAQAATTKAKNAYNDAVAGNKAIDSATEATDIISVLNALVGGSYENSSFGDITSDVRYAPLPRTTTNATINRWDVEVLSRTGAYNSGNIWSDTVVGYDTNQTYKSDDVYQGTAPRQFAGLASQAADFFNKRDNGKITFKFTAAAKSGSTWVNGGVPSTEVGLKSALAGTNFGMFWNYNTSTGQL